jgi:hypothetical protein
MPDEGLIAAVVDTAQRLCASSKTGWVDGEAIAAELGLDPQDSSSSYNAFRAAADQGRLVCDYPGGMELPRVRLP